VTLPVTQLASERVLSDRARTAGAGAAASSRPAADIKATTGPYVQFEAFVLQSFIQSMMPDNASEVYGEGTAGEVWKSMLAEKMAKEIAEHGGIGIAKMIAPKNGAVAESAGAHGPALRTGAAERIADWRLAAAATAGMGKAAADGSPE
jgi:flagellar protein FlgJ